MQQASPSTVQSATTPTAAQPPAANVVTPQMMTRRDIEALKSRADELSRQIVSATERRARTRDALRSASGADRTGLEQRLGVLDARIARLEQDIDENGRQLASIPARLAATEEQPRGSMGGSRNRRSGVDDNMVPIFVVFTLFVLAPIAVSIARMFWKRGSVPAKPMQSPETIQRLERMEQAIDTIAIEMERVSEGQRFITRILAENRAPAALGEGQRGVEQVAAQAGERNAVPRS